MLRDGEQVVLAALEVVLLVLVWKSLVWGVDHESGAAEVDEGDQRLWSVEAEGAV